MGQRCVRLVGVLVVLGACETAPTTPAEVTASQAVVQGLVTQLVVEPAELAAGGSFLATYTVRNTTLAPVRLESACVTHANLVVLRNGDEARFTGSGSGCYTALGLHEIPPGHTLEQQWRVVAEIVTRYHPDGREPERVLPAPGSYAVRLQPNVMRIDEIRAELPVLERTVTVR
jgi:hypothetical protein